MVFVWKLIRHDSLRYDGCSLDGYGHCANDPIMKLVYQSESRMAKSRRSDALSCMSSGPEPQARWPSCMQEEEEGVCVSSPNSPSPPLPPAPPPSSSSLLLLLLLLFLLHHLPPSPDGRSEKARRLRKGEGNYQGDEIFGQKGQLSNTVLDTVLNTVLNTVLWVLAIPTHTHKRTPPPLYAILTNSTTPIFY